MFSWVCKFYIFHLGIPKYLRVVVDVIKVSFGILFFQRNASAEETQDPSSTEPGTECEYRWFCQFYPEHVFEKDGGYSETCRGGTQNEGQENKWLGGRT